MKSITTQTIRKKKLKNEIITMLTAYDYPTALILDEAGIDITLVGDSLGMVVLGYENTTQVTMEDMLHHVKAVTRGSKHPLVVADLPFLSYHTGIYKTVKNAGRLIQEGKANAVKLEGGKEVTEQIQAIINAGIPVMGHIGLTPQSINQLGGYYIQGKTDEQAKKLLADAKALEEAGAFAIVLECIPTELSKLITENIEIPTIGIGAGPHCNGQVLVTHDILNLYSNKTPKFAKKYTDVHGEIMQAALDYIQDVKHKNFPSTEHVFHLKQDVIDSIYGGDKL
ncbi:3-methyl-2-oxobutanoate hydroxymethyltransferase [Vallitalea longa]|uniref:3-methyl-2-oxobutanoate hydroxymethyltransferase n=1 Tax=Vallitalea longa TaxID=2936439 RepID=A0A9W6DE04_9FIRM|nr:3-methyl-2-oxobutanoate hydroxymethyltransferase [Vallitalea longa]GKX29581.1 3-methyl-2-oxobutanoate hydroxymethyltransferase [Vallitalea longa]